MDALVTALYATMSKVVVCTALARPLVKRLFASCASSIRPREIGEAHHLPDRAHTVIVTLARIRVVPRLVTHAAEMVDIHRHSSVLLRFDKV